ncbi:hypothetical protein EDC04DRAFT_2634101 [Pisolithus marmoratus]|nr:hypothetical protein EDC04DRAFT_2634101 [Pisolithus marmoratus]
MVALHRPTVHGGSLVDPALHSPALLELLEIKLSRPVIEYVVDCTVDTVNYAMGRPSSSKRGRSVARYSDYTPFTTFVTKVLARAEVSIPTLLVTLVYINRAKPHLQIALEEWACERVFLGALIIASKYLNDSTLKNVQWAFCSGVFGKRDIGRVEREFLEVLGFELSISEDDILSHHNSLSAIALPVNRYRHPRHLAPTTTTHPLYHQSDHSATCPDLAPSSPKSSSSGSSLSPRTPEPLVYTTNGTKHKPPVDRVVTDVPPPVPPKTAATLDILQAFSLPSNSPHSHMAPSESASSYLHKSRHHPRFAPHSMTQVTA